MNMCRDFQPEQLVQDFDFNSFMGKWYATYESVITPFTTGRCPSMLFSESAQTYRRQKMSTNYDYFHWKFSYKGLAGMVDNERKYSGSFDKELSMG